jgi:hypothetical protein
MGYAAGKKTFSGAYCPEKKDIPVFRIKLGNKFSADRNRIL